MNTVDQLTSRLFFCVIIGISDKPVTVLIGVPVLIPTTASTPALAKKNNSKRIIIKKCGSNK